MTLQPLEWLSRGLEEVASLGIWPGSESLGETDLRALSEITGIPSEYSGVNHFVAFVDKLVARRKKFLTDNEWAFDPHGGDSFGREQLHSLRQRTEEEMLAQASSLVDRVLLLALIHHEAEAQGLEVLGQGEPEYALVPSPSRGDAYETTSFIPFAIYGKEVLLVDVRTMLEGLQHVSNQRRHVFNTRIPTTPASVRPMELRVDLAQ